MAAQQLQIAAQEQRHSDQMNQFMALMQGNRGAGGGDGNQNQGNQGRTAPLTKHPAPPKLNQNVTLSKFKAWRKTWNDYARLLKV